MPALRSAFVGYLALFAPMLPVSSSFAHEFDVPLSFQSVPSIFLKTTCGRNALAALLLIGSAPGRMMNVNQYLS